MSKVQTKKIAAKAVRPKMKLSLSAPTVVIRSIERLADIGPAANDNLLLVNFEVVKGHLKGKKGKFTIHEADNLDVILKDSLLKRSWDWIVYVLWAAKAK